MITINGKVYKGNSIAITNDKIIIDEQEIREESNKGRIIKVEVTGNLAAVASSSFRSIFYDKGYMVCLGNKHDSRKSDI